tara:strand:+ start:16085 stop:20539 length:4455 start_codon:yes stop_codon:yes gene_type:complete
MSLYRELIDYYGDTATITNILFSLQSPDQIRSSGIEITNHTLYYHEQNGISKPERGGLYDDRMGTVDHYSICATCNQRSNLCPGHFGYINLVKPVFYWHYIGTVLDILKCVCFRCSNLLISENDDILKYKYDSNESRFKAIAVECKKKKKCCAENGCGAIQPNRIYKQDIGNIFAEWKFVDKESKKVLITGEIAHTILKRIKDHHIELLGFSTEYCRPEWMICSVLPVAPPAVRPSVRQDNNQRSDDDLTYKLIDIIKTNKKLESLLELNKPEKFINSTLQLLQFHITTMIDNEQPFGSSFGHATIQRSGRALKSLKQRIKDKEGRIRYNLMGKRVDFSARSVITPDPNLNIDQLGVPLKIAMNLTYPEKVNDYNINKIKEYILNGPFTYPGVKSIRKSKEDSIKNLKHIDLEKVIEELEIGDIVYRHLIDDDIVLFNRQPSLHKMSMMGHRVKVMDALTFRLNVCVTTPYNADFDGDEMNMHVPQSINATTELKYLTLVPTQIMNPSTSTPIIQLIQDTLVGLYRLSINDEKMLSVMPKKLENLEDKMFYFDKRTTMNIMMKNYNFVDMRQLGQSHDGYYNGKQIISTILQNINLVNNNITIKHGQLLKGSIKGSIGKTQLIDTIYKNYGKDKTADFINNAQGIINYFLYLTGFSVGVSDLTTEQNTLQKIIKNKKENVKKILKDIKLGLIENKYSTTLSEECEVRVKQELNSVETDTSALVITKLNDVSNRFVNMVKARSKGKDTNISQMIACVGQQNVDGKRIPIHYQNRTLPHFTQYDNGPKARGFIEHSYYSGLDPFEYFFHAMSGREGLIDTAVKTSETGYIQRKLVKVLEDVKVCYDNTVRNHNNEIIQLKFNYDMIDSTKLEKVSYTNFVDLSIEDFENQYKHCLNDDLKYYLKAVVVRKALTNKNKEIYEKYYEELLNDRIYVMKTVLNNNLNFVGDKTYLPFNLHRLCEDLKYKYNLDEINTKSDLNPMYIIENIYKLIKKFDNNQIIGIFLKFSLNPNIIIKKYRFDINIFEELINKIELTYNNALIHPGEMVGVIAAQSIGGQATQMTLNTFHLAGTSQSSNVTQGIPRFNELLNISKVIKSPYMKFYLKEQVNDVKNIKKIKNNIIETKLSDLILVTTINFDPDDMNTIIEEDKDLINNYLKFQKLFDIDNLLCSSANKCPFIIRFEFSKKKMIDRDVSMIDIYTVIKTQLPDTIDCIYQNNNNNKLVMRLRYNQNNGDDDLLWLRNLEKHILKLQIKGVKNIKDVIVNFTNVKTNYMIEEGDAKGSIIESEDIVLQTVSTKETGNNLEDMLAMDMIDITRIESNDVVEINNILGIEAAREMLLNEFHTVIETSGGEVNIRHLQLLVDLITYTGELLPVDRFGVKKKPADPLAKISFEDIPHHLYTSAQFGVKDSCKGISGNIMLGQEAACGTGICNILFDEQEFFTNIKSTVKESTDNEFVIVDYDKLYFTLEYNKLKPIDIKIPEIIIN